MTTTYKCDICNKEYKRMCDLNKHKNRKTLCKKNETKEDIKNIVNKNSITNIFKSCLDLLRSEGLTGETALRNITYMITLKLLEPHFGKDIDIDNYDYNFEEHFDDDEIEYNKKRLLELVRFTELYKCKDEEGLLIGRIKNIWDYILSKHPITKNIFVEGKGFDIKNTLIYKELINKFNCVDLSNIDDVLGDAYEEVIKDIMTGKVLGQFFTPPFIKQIMIKLINPVLHKDGKIDSCCDPTMGTGGFLITYLKNILKQSKDKNIDIDWKYIKKSIYGKEIDLSTYQLALSNLLISTGHIFDLENGNSLKNPIYKKFDNIMANPPFGIKGLKYKDILNSVNKEYIPIETNNAVSLFLQTIINMLKIDGKCAIVVPYGQDLFSKNKIYITIREYLVKTCDLKEIICLPAGIFTNTTIKTCIFYFEKKKETNEVLQINNKTKKIKEYKFIDETETKIINFYEMKDNKKELLIQVPIEKIIENNYVLNYIDYKEKIEIKENKNIVFQKLVDICDIKIGGTPSRDEIKYYENGDNLWVSIKELNGGYIYDTKEKINNVGVQNSNVKLLEKDTVLFSFKLSIGKTAIAGKSLYTNEAIAGLTSKNSDILNNKYLYYYLTLTDFTKFGSGIIGNGSLNKGTLGQIEIPIPSIDYQKQIIEKLDCLNEISYNSTIKNLKKQNNIYISNNEKNNIKKLGEICGINQGTLLTKLNMNNDGKYNVIGGGKIIGNHDEKNRDGNEFVLTRVGDLNINFMNTSYYLTDNGFSVKSNDENIILTKYIYYFCLYNKKLINELYNGTAQKVISKTVLKMIDISIPLLDKQKQIVEFCENNDSVIKLLEKNIENNKNLSKQIIDNITI